MTGSSTPTVFDRVAIALHILETRVLPAVLEARGGPRGGRHAVVAACELDSALSVLRAVELPPETAAVLARMSARAEPSDARPEPQPGATPAPPIVCGSCGGDLRLVAQCGCRPQRAATTGGAEPWLSSLTCCSRPMNPMRAGTGKPPRADDEMWCDTCGLTVIRADAAAKPSAPAPPARGWTRVEQFKQRVGALGEVVPRAFAHYTCAVHGVFASTFRIGEPQSPTAPCPIAETFRDGNTESLRRCGRLSQPVPTEPAPVPTHLQTAQALSDRNSAETLQALKLDVLTKRASEVLDAWDGLDTEMKGTVVELSADQVVAVARAIAQLRKVVPR